MYVTNVHASSCIFSPYFFYIGTKRASCKILPPNQSSKRGSATGSPKKTVDPIIWSQDAVDGSWNGADVHVRCFRWKRSGLCQIKLEQIKVHRSPHFFVGFCWILGRFGWFLKILSKMMQNDMALSYTQIARLWFWAFSCRFRFRSSDPVILDFLYLSIYLSIYIYI